MRSSSKLSPRRSRTLLPTPNKHHHLGTTTHPYRLKLDQAERQKILVLGVAKRSKQLAADQDLSQAEATAKQLRKAAPKGPGGGRSLLSVRLCKLHTARFRWRWPRTRCRPRTLDLLDLTHMCKRVLL